MQSKQKRALESDKEDGLASLELWKHLTQNSKLQKAPFQTVDAYSLPRLKRVKVAQSRSLASPRISNLTPAGSRDNPSTTAPHPSPPSWLQLGAVAKVFSHTLPIFQVVPDSISLGRERRRLHDQGCAQEGCEG
jgi:hypothetical protein